MNTQYKSFGDVSCPLCFSQLSFSKKEMVTVGNRTYLCPDCGARICAIGCPRFCPSCGDKKRYCRSCGTEWPVEDLIAALNYDEWEEV